MKIIKKLICIGVIDKINKKPFWKREKTWKEYESLIVESIVKPINELINKN